MTHNPKLRLVQAIAEAPVTSSQPAATDTNIKYLPGKYVGPGSQDPTTTGSPTGQYSLLSKITVLGNTIDNVPRLKDAWPVTGGTQSAGQPASTNPAAGTKLCVFQIGTSLLIAGIEVGTTY